MDKLIRKIFRKPVEYYEQNARIRQKFQRRTLVIHHYCPHTFNVGDHFVIHSLRQHIRKHIPNAVFMPRSISQNRGWGAPFRLRGENIGFSNKYADAVIVGGSDNYRNWALRIDGEEIKKLQPPLFLLGLGVSSNNLNEKPLIGQDKYFQDIKNTNEKALISTVRDQLSLDFLRSLGIEKAVMTGCPSLFLSETNRFIHNPKGDLILTFPFPVNKQVMPERFEILLKLIGIILKRYGKEKVVIACHDDRDLPAVQEFFPNARIFYSNYTEDYYPIYQNALMVLGSRLHGNLMAASQGTPFLNIDIDIRGQGFTKTFGLERWNLEYSDPHLEDYLLERIDQVIQGNLNQFKVFLEVKKGLRESFNSTMKKTADLILEKILEK